MVVTLRATALRCLAMFGKIARKFVILPAQHNKDARNSTIKREREAYYIMNKYSRQQAGNALYFGQSRWLAPGDRCWKYVQLVYPWHATKSSEHFICSPRSRRDIRNNSKPQPQRVNFLHRMYAIVPDQSKHGCTIELKKQRSYWYF